MTSDAKVWALIVAIAGPSSALPAETTEKPWDCKKGTTWVSTAKTRLSPSEAVAVASSAAKKSGTSLEKFRQTSLCFDASKNRWTVYFDGVEPMPGNHFLVWVRDDTGSTQIKGGA
jgi:hypothetical protein